ncbi:nuclear transport factor 2 family protein [Ochrobactrum quorumnocens]|uniref:nuclear transport factor 2 family protein n=1 Tax=Brucella/Ochrobactrum group TaxID=2826938 RepID=UPI003853897C
MQLTCPIEAYFAADRGTDRVALTSSFAADAVVKDEGAVHTGHEEILAWRLSSTEKYADLVTEPIEQILDGDRVIVRCKVSGDFPSSPVVLDFAFTLADQKINLLDIH